MRRAVVAILLPALLLMGCSGKRKADLVIGKPQADDDDRGHGAHDDRHRAAARPRPRHHPRAAAGARGLKGANGRPYGTHRLPQRHSRCPATCSSSSSPDPTPGRGEDIRRTRADSIHLLAVNPTDARGHGARASHVTPGSTSPVTAPARSTRRCSSAVPSCWPRRCATSPGCPSTTTCSPASPGLAEHGRRARRRRRLRRPAHERQRNSGARFEPGWHHFNGARGPAFSRDRHDVPNGDF